MCQSVRMCRGGSVYVCVWCHPEVRVSGGGRVCVRVPSVGLCVCACNAVQGMCVEEGCVCVCARVCS